MDEINTADQFLIGLMLATSIDEAVRWAGELYPAEVVAESARRAEAAGASRY